MSRTIFSTVRAPHEPAFTVESLAITHTGRPSTVPTPVTTPSAGRSPASALASSALLDERALVEQQGQPVAHEQLPLPCELGRLLLEVALEGPLGGGPELVAHDAPLPRPDPHATPVLDILYRPFDLREQYAAHPGGTLRFSRFMAVVARPSSPPCSASSAAGAGAQSSKPKADDVGITDSEIRLAVIADVDTPVQPGLFQKSVDAMKAWADVVNKAGGVAGRKVVIDFIDSKLNPNETRNAIITGVRRRLRHGRRRGAVPEQRRRHGRMQEQGR